MGCGVWSVECGVWSGFRLRQVKEREMRKIVTGFLAVVFIGALVLSVGAAGVSEVGAAVDSTAAYMLREVANPQVGSVGGEWAVIGLARSGHNVPDSYFENYYKTVERYVKARNGVLHDRRYTDYSRVILGLTAAGYDPRDVGGFDLTAPLEDFDKTLWQGINGPVWALIALDSLGYPNSQRDNYVAEILRRQTPDGGWNLTAGASGAVGSNEKGDPDITGMVLQALAKYQDRRDVKAATDKALVLLSSIQENSGGFSRGSSDESSVVESAVQVLVALCELGVPFDDARFVKNGKSVVDNILSFKNEDGSFGNPGDRGGNNQMVAEQALYGLVAARRALDGANSLYRMDDTIRRAGFAPLPVEPGLPGKNTDVSVMPVIKPGSTFPDTQGHSNQHAIEVLSERGIINGKADSMFDPDATMTRAEFAAVVTRGLGLAQNTKFAVQNYYFDDVGEGDWFSVFVYAAAYYGIVNGTSESVFDPNSTITRQEAAVMVERAAKLCGMDTGRSETGVRDTLAQFVDYRMVADWAQVSMAFCFDSGILDDSGLEIGSGEAVRRCEIAEMLFRMLGLANLLEN